VCETRSIPVKRAAVPASLALIWRTGDAAIVVGDQALWQLEYRSGPVEGVHAVSTNRARQAPRPSGRPASQDGQRRPRPLPKGDTLFTPQASPARQAIEQRSATPLLWLHQLPRWLAPVLAVALLVAGLAVGGWAGAIALFGLAVVLAWLASMSWPRLSAQGRLLRVAVIGLVVLVAVFRGLHG